MKYLTSSTTALSMVIAVVLFVVASWFEGDPPPPLPTAEIESPQLIDSVRQDTPVRDETATQDCRAAEQRLRDRLDASQSCRVDADCTLLDYGYPIQCLTAVAQSEVSALRREYRNYEQACTFRVFYDCPAEPLERRAVCRNNSCVVELRTLDLLKDQTLEHLGIEPSAAGPEP